MSNWGNNFIIVSFIDHIVRTHIQNLINQQGLITPPMISGIGFGTYVFFAAFCLLALVWVWFFIPETNGRTLEQMDAVFGDSQTADEQSRRGRIEQDIRREYESAVTVSEEKVA